MDQQRSGSQKLPAGLAGVLNSPEDNRDSAYYSGTDASSKHTSAASVGLGSSFHHNVTTDNTPSPTATTNHHPQPLVSPINSNMSVASMVSPTTPGSADPRRYERPQSLDSAPNSATFGDIPEAMSRRESVDSRINQGFGNMQLGNSPYASHNQSTTSIHNTHNIMHQQRNPRSNFEALSVNRVSNGYQPNVDRNPDGHGRTGRVAPAITGPATSQIARAAEPTKGQAWAFPEEEIHKLPSATNQPLIDSRRSSIADSLASSQYTTESRLPPGQRRLEDGLGDYHQQQRLSSASGEFSTVHHHTLQHRQLSDLQNEESGAHGGSQPYSRTPELRVSHKLAERKRRTEMKELFEQLRDLMPQERGTKASKWEILTKAIAEHQKQTDLIKNMQHHINMQAAEIEKLRAENQGLHGAQRTGPVQPMPNHPFAPEQYPRHGPPELPPLRTISSDSMAGIQYGTNGYRPNSDRQF